MMAAGKGTGRLLVVDDDKHLLELLVLVLRREGYEVGGADSAAAALNHMAASAPDLVVLDIDLGDDDGRVLLGQLQATWQVPVVLISGHGDVADRVLGLRLGADDYLSKPFAPVELAARVETVLRRQGRSVATSDLRTGVAGAQGTGEPPGCGLDLDEATRDVSVRGIPVALTAREFDVLAFLVRSPRQVFTRAQLLDQVWDSRPGWQGEATVTEHIRRIRAKIEVDPHRPRWIVTVRGVGYRYEE